jgi:hypothetical protein
MERHGSRLFLRLWEHFGQVVFQELLPGFTVMPSFCNSPSELMSTLEWARRATGVLDLLVNHHMARRYTAFAVMESGNTGHQDCGPIGHSVHGPVLLMRLAIGGMDLLVNHHLARRSKRRHRAREGWNLLVHGRLGPVSYQATAALDINNVSIKGA